VALEWLHDSMEWTREKGGGERRKRLRSVGGAAVDSWLQSSFPWESFFLLGARLHAHNRISQSNKLFSFSTFSCWCYLDSCCSQEQDCSCFFLLARWVGVAGALKCKSRRDKEETARWKESFSTAACEYATYFVA